MITLGLLSIVEEQLDLSTYELQRIKNHRIDFDFYVSGGKVEFTNGGFTYFSKIKGEPMIGRTKRKKDE